MLLEIPYKPSVAKDDPDYGARGYANDTDQVRIVRGADGSRFQAQGGWVAATGDPALQGLPRSILQWADNMGTLYCAIGTNTKLYAFSGGSVYDVTPFRVTNHALGNDPFATTLGSSTVLVTDTAHGATDGDTVYFNGATAVGGLTIGGASGNFAAAPFQTTSGSPIVIVTLAAHGLTSGCLCVISGSAAVGGITPSGLYTVYVPSGATNFFLIQHSSSATSSTTGGGAGASFVNYKPYVLTIDQTDANKANEYTINAGSVATGTVVGGGAGVTTYYEINVGLASGVIGSGYGTGAYGAGPYGLATPPSASFQPRVWALTSFGQDLEANPLNGSIYKWQRNWSQRAAVLTNAPTQVLAVITTAEHILMAAGCNDINGTFDPLFVRWTTDGDDTAWTATVSNLAGSLRLGQGDYVVALKAVNGGTLCWTDKALYFIQFSGNAAQPYQAIPIGTDCGLIGPNAAVSIGSVVYWITPAGAWFSWAGGQPQAMLNPNRLWFTNLLASGQSYKIFAAPDSTWTGMQWHAPDSTSNEISYYLRLDALELGFDPIGGWSNGTTTLSCVADHGPWPNQIGVTIAGVIYFLESGTSANGAPISRHVDWNPVELPSQASGNGTFLVILTRFVADTTGSYGSLSVTWTGQRWPNGPSQTKGPYTWTATTQYQDMRMAARQIASSWTSSGTDDYWRLSSIRGDMTQGPRR